MLKIEVIPNFIKSNVLINSFIHWLIIIEICAEIDIYIEESTALIYEEDLDSALVHMKNASKKLQVKINLIFI